MFQAKAGGMKRDALPERRGKEKSGTILDRPEVPELIRVRVAPLCLFLASNPCSFDLSAGRRWVEVKVQIRLFIAYSYHRESLHAQSSTSNSRVAKEKAETPVAQRIGCLYPTDAVLGCISTRRARIHVGLKWPVHAPRSHRFMAHAQGRNITHSR